MCRRSSTPSVRRPSVWPLPSSLATTKGIEFSFFSSGYLDVSLPRVPPVKLWIHLTVTGHCPGRVPPFGYPWINAYLRLPMAFRSLSRPSSAISALASTLRSCSLDLASSMQTLCLLRLVGTDCSQSLFCLFLCSFQGAVKNLSILQNDTDYANHTSDSGPAAIYDLQNPRFSSNRLTSL